MRMRNSPRAVQRSVVACVTCTWYQSKSPCTTPLMRKTPERPHTVWLIWIGEKAGELTMHPPLNWSLYPSEQTGSPSAMAPAVQGTRHGQLEQIECGPSQFPPVEAQSLCSEIAQVALA